MIVIGICLEVCAAALGTTSKQLIAYSEHAKKPWLFHVGASINIFVGPVVDASAYAFAPQVVIAPFACLDVIFNAITAPFTLDFQNERFTKTHGFGVLLVALGAASTSVFGSVTEDVLDVYAFEQQLLKRQSVCYMIAELFLIIMIYSCLKWQLLSATLRGIALGVIAGILMGNVFFLKGIVSMVRTTISSGDGAAWLRPTPYLCVAGAAGGAILGHIFMRKGLGEYKGIFMVTMFEGAHITAACLSGCVVMEEMAHAPWWRYSLYWASVLTLVAGMCVINRRAAESQLDESQEARPSVSFHIAQSFLQAEEWAARRASEEVADAGLAPAAPTAAPVAAGPLQDEGEVGLPAGEPPSSFQNGKVPLTGDVEMGSFFVEGRADPGGAESRNSDAARNGPRKQRHTRTPRLSRH